MKPPEPGLYPGLPEDEYRAWDALNQSTIKIAAERSLLHARYAQTNPKPVTDAQIEGQAFHLLLLEPEKHAERFAECPVDDKGRRHRRDTAKGKEAWAAFEDANPLAWPLKRDVMNEHLLMREGVFRNPTARDLIENAAAKEVSACWHHPEYGFPCKGRFDLYTEYLNYGVIADIKTSKNASWEKFRKDAVDYGYVIQSPWYLDGLAEVSPADRRFLFIVIEKDPPYGCQVHELTSLSMFEGRHRIRKVCAGWARALEEDSFPSYPSGISQLSVPKWALTHEWEETDLE